MFIADNQNNRVLGFGAPFSTHEATSVVLGQANFTSYVSNIESADQTHVTVPNAIAFDAKTNNLFVIDSGSNRVVEFVNAGSGTNFVDGMDASVVLGQPDFTGNSSALGPAGLFSPTGAAADSQGDLFVADGSNRRGGEVVPTLSHGVDAR